MSNQKRSLPFVTLDVITSVPLEGNQLAVFSDARGLSEAEMQAVAREMNLSETTFVFPRDPATERDRGVRVRIFTTDEELPFAGHPTLGTAMALRRNTGKRGHPSKMQKIMGVHVFARVVTGGLEDMVEAGRDSGDCRH